MRKFRITKAGDIWMVEMEVPAFGWVRLDKKFHSLLAAEKFYAYIVGGPNA